MRNAAELWAEARRRGQPTPDPKELGGDVILAAHKPCNCEPPWPAKTRGTSANSSRR